MQIHKYQIEIGKIGEAYVYDLERKKLMNTPYWSKVDKTKALNPINGYDILSFEDDGTPVHIEVKTSAKLGEDFFISVNDINTAKK